MSAIKNNTYTVNHGYKSSILVLIFCSYIRFALISVGTTESPHLDVNLLISNLLNNTSTIRRTIKMVTIAIYSFYSM